MNSIDCAAVRHLLGEGIDISSNSDLSIVVRAHLNGCSDCQSYLHSLEKTIDCYRSYNIEVPEKAESLLEDTWNLLKKEAK